MTADNIQPGLEENGNIRQFLTDTNRPRLLFLAFYFPPLKSVACIRAFNIAKYLSRAGWDVSVVTPEPMLWQEPDEPRRIAAELDKWGVERIYTGHRWRSLSSGHVKRSYTRGFRWFLGGLQRRIARAMGIDEMAGWYSEAERACAKLRPGDIDVVMATGSPFGAFRVAQHLGSRLRCPYVLDYRDLWTGNPHSRRAHKERDENIERGLLQDCAAVSVVSPSMAEVLSARFGMAKRVHVIPNGYTLDDFEGIEPKVFEHFAIIYTGQFLPPKSTAEPLMKALKKLMEMESNQSWRFHYYGPHNSHVQNFAQKHGVENMVELHGMVPRRECLAAIRGAGVAIVITSDSDTGDMADRGIITGKIFEPIGLGTPVLVVAPLHSDVEIVIRATGKAAVFPGSDIDGMVTFFAKLMQGQVPASNNPGEYAWSNLILRMDSLLRSAIINYRQINKTIKSD